MAHDDPEGWDYYNQTVAAAQGDPDIFILSNLNNVGSVEVNAFQVHSAALIQKSIREGFGLTVTEGLWKGRPMVAGRAGGIVDQVQDGETGYLVESVIECAEALHSILERPRRTRGDGAHGARSTSVATSSRRGSCVTGSRSSTASPGTTSRAPSSSSRARPSRPAARQPGVPWRMPGRRKLIVVSNRGPVTFSLDPGGHRLVARAAAEASSRASAA